MKTPATRALLARLAVISAAVLASCGDGSSQALAGIVRTPPLDVSGVTLPAAGDPEGAVAMVAPPGELYLVYFGYTSCPDVCPTTLSDISVALGDLPDDQADRVTVAMATLDPERDSSEVLAGYLDHFVEGSLALRTTSDEELARATDAFGVRWTVEEHEAGGAYDVSHSAVTYVVDDTGSVVVEWPFGLESESMTRDLSVLLDKESR